MAAKNSTDITGQRFGRLIVLERRDSKQWLCKCDCGTVKIFLKGNLRHGKSQSCGCLQREKVAARLLPYRLKHGHSTGGQSPTFVAWQRMKQRCYYRGAPHYADYGGRGITICDRWRDSFANFLADMGEKPKGNRISLGRIDNDGNYEPR